MSEKKSICYECKSFGCVVYDYGGTRLVCKFGIGDAGMVTNCPFFEEKGDTKEKSKAEAKAVGNKGKYPRKQPKKTFITRENIKEEIRKTKEVLNTS